MSTTFEWNIKNIECVLGDDGITKVAKIVHYTYTATSSETDSDGNPYQKIAIGPIILDDPSSETFKDFEDLSKEDVIQWILSKMGTTQEELNNMLESDIEKDINPPTITGLPSSWM